jgi:hypothetical protein
MRRHEEAAEGKTWPRVDAVTDGSGAENGEDAAGDDENAGAEDAAKH